MKVFRMDHDTNAYCGFLEAVDRGNDKVQRAMRDGKSVQRIWKPRKVELASGRKGDFAASPLGWTEVALSKKAVEALQPLLEGTAELLPFSYKKDQWWILYLPRPVDCLDIEKTVYFTDDRTPDNIHKPAFVRDKLPREAIFRVPGGSDYFVTSEFKNAVEQNGLTGLHFVLMWSDDESEEGSREKPRAASPTKQPQMKKPGRWSKRDRLLARLWEEVIDRRGSPEWIDEQLATPTMPGDADFSVLNDAGRLLATALAKGMDRDALLRLARSLAYEVVFDTLVAIEEEGADTGPALRALHEDLLMADPERFHD